MKQWDVIMFPFSKEKRHPAVIISNDETCQNSDIEEVNALLCSSAKVNRPPKSTEEILDESDGLDWKTVVRCDKIYLLSKARFDDLKGNVTVERRHLIARKMVEVLRLPIHRR
ncbi:MAG: type II toxin-antitoxin system PemK/MazF family toxin [Verrucomicrobiota bacterium]|nr:type II toxin-antitoxin system PemK/MazF family toxin [Verrucomicrobiota bacterium]